MPTVPLVCPEEQKAMKSYLQQQHRFEIRGYRLFYNEQEVPFENFKASKKMFGKNSNNSCKIIHKIKLLKIEFF